MKLMKVLWGVVVVLLLVGILIPHCGYLHNRPDWNRTRHRMKSIIMAVKQYETHYGVLPFDQERLPDSAEYDAFIARLEGDNARGVRFIEPGHDLDAWGRRYRIVLDADYDGKIRLTRLDQPLFSDIVIWSDGEDPLTDEDDVVSWE